MSRLKLAAAGVLALAFLQVLPAATAAYSGTFRGTTGQGKPISFVVGGGERIVSLNLVYALPACEIEQKVTTSVPIKGGRFTFSLNLPNNAVSVSGRFTSASAAAGTLTASSDCGRASTTWKATRGAGAPTSTAKPKPAKPKKKAKPEPLTRFEGLWEGDMTFPAGLDPDLVDFLDPLISFDVFDGAIEAADFPFLIQGAGCATGDYVEKDFRPPAKFKGNKFSFSFTTPEGIKVTLAGQFDSTKRAHGTVTTTGTFEGCEGGAELTWRASNLG
jgi:hypothetical protein